MKSLVLGTTNPGKIQEWTGLLQNYLSVVGVNALGTFPKPAENGSTFSENARQKAVHYAKLAKECVLAEDGGYEIDALGGAPGVKSRRILPGGQEGTDEDLVNYVLEKLKGTPLEERTVQLTVAVAMADPEGKIIYEDQESFAGIVAEKPGPVWIPGYPFRTIHLIPELGKTYAELNPKEYERHSHKRRIAKRIVKFLSEQGLM